jgi:hypothetical protein
MNLYVNGTCHGVPVFTQDLHWLMYGKRIIKSI